MALIYPLPLPAVTLYCRKFAFEIPQRTSLTDGVEDQTVDNGAARWSGEYDTPVLGGTDFKLMMAWEAAMKKSRARCLAHDARCIYPFYYQGIGWKGLVRAGTSTAFDGTCTLASVGDDGYTLGLSGLPVGFKLTSGDALSFIWDSSRYAYHTLGPVGDAVAAADGTMSVTVDPVTFGGYSEGATVRFEKPVFFGRVVKWTKAERDDSQLGSWSFVVLQSHMRAVP